MNVRLYPEDRVRTRPWNEIPQEILESREKLQQKLADSSDTILQEFVDTLEDRSRKVQKWFDK